MDPALIVRRNARIYAGNAAVRFEGREQTYAQMYERACRLANVFRVSGAGPGDAVAMLGDNSAEAIEQVAACALGAHPRATLYTYHSPAVNRYLLELTGARVLVVQEKYATPLLAMLKDLPQLRAVIVFGGPAPSGTLDYEAALGAASSQDREVSVTDDHPHIIRFSSGTTGRPKGIYHSIADWRKYNAEWRWSTPMVSERSRYLVPTSLAHLGVAFLWSMFSVGGCILPMPSFDASRTLELLESEGITHAVAAPVMIREMLKDPTARTRDFSALQCLMYAGSPIAASTLGLAIEVFGKALYQMYGQSESAPISMLLPHQHVLNGTDKEARRLRSVGRPTANVVVTIRDDEGQVLPAGAIGEIAARGCTMTGLWNDPDATAARTLPDGSILTRDMGYLDEDGFIYLVDRKDDMIVSGGYNVWPTELEEALQRHPAVAEACVFGVPDEKWGETPKAVVVLREGEQASAEELMAFVKEIVGSVKKITSVDFMPALPRTTTGKVMRSTLKDPWWAGHAGRIAGS